MLESIITEVGYKIDYFNDERLNERLLKGILARIKVEDEEECWEWTGSFKKIKHPAIGYKSIKVYVADIICNLIGKPKKEYHKIERTCSNFKCFNPNHIKIVPVLKNYTFFDSIDCEEKAYWLGFILADGCVRTKKRTQTLQSGEVSTIKKGSGLEICLQEKDKKHLEKFASIFERKVTTKIVKKQKDR